MKCTLRLLLVLVLAIPTHSQTPAPQPAKRLEQLENKTILLFTPHPDDDVFGAGGTIALLNRNHNKVFIAVYTNDDKGSYDPDMNSQRLAQIRRSEQEVSEGMLGTPKENISWMGYDDGMLEYAAQPKLTEEATAIIRRIRPDVLLSVDPGEWYARWHKTVWQRSTHSMRCAPPNSGYISRTKNCNRVCSRTKSQRYISFTLRHRKRIIL
jgi:hypothetical protein